MTLYTQRISNMVTRPDFRKTLESIAPDETKVFRIAGDTVNLLRATAARMKKQDGYAYSLKVDAIENTISVTRLR